MTRGKRINPITQMNPLLIRVNLRDLWLAVAAAGTTLDCAQPQCAAFDVGLAGAGGEAYKQIGQHAIGSGKAPQSSGESAKRMKLKGAAA